MHDVNTGGGMVKYDRTWSVGKAEIPFPYTIALIGNTFVRVGVIMLVI